MLIFFKGMHSRPYDDADASTLFDHSARFSQATVDGVTSDPLLYLKTPNPYYPVREIVPPRDTYILHAWVKLDAANVDNIRSYQTIFGLKDNGQYQVEIAIGPSQSAANNPSIRVTRGRQNSGTGGTSVQIDFQRFDSTTVGDPTTGYVHIAAKVYIHPSAGTVEVRVNGTVVVNLTGANTQATGNQRINVIDFAGGSYSYNDIMRMRDIVVMDTTGASFNDFLIAPFTVPIDPDGTGDTEDWTRSGGSNDYEAVDDLATAGTGGPFADEDTSYVSTSTTTARQLATYTDVSENKRILAVAVTPITRQATRGYPLALATVAKLGASVAVSDGLAMPYRSDVDNLETRYGCLAGGWNYLLEAPGGLVWTDARVNSCQFGIEHVEASV